MSRLNDLTGQRFSRLTVIARVPCRTATKYLCQCDCGQTRHVNAQHLLAGAQVSCGCLRNSRTFARSFKHGHKTRGGCTPEYNAWCNAKSRCYDTRHPRFADWGGRGITMCDRWRDNFAAFMADMGPRPPGRQLDRIDNNGSYSPENCRWATKSEQSRNRRRWHRSLHQHRDSR